MIPSVVRNFKRSVKASDSSLVALTESIRQKIVIGFTMEIPEIVKVTVRNAYLVIGGISAMILTMHGKSYEGLNWYGAMQHSLMASDQFRRCLYNEIGDYLVAKGVSASKEYPWLVRCTEDIRRDCPEAKTVYKAIGIDYDPTAAYPIETFPVVRVDRNNKPLNPILLTDFITRYTSNFFFFFITR